MHGSIRVISHFAEARPHRLIHMRRAPSQAQLEAIVGGKLAMVESFDTVLVAGESKGCMALRCRTRKTPEPEPNVFAQMLWLHALVRKYGFSETPPGGLETLRGPVVLLYGDEEFWQALIASLLFGLREADASEPEKKQGTLG